MALWRGAVVVGAAAHHLSQEIRYSAAQRLITGLRAFGNYHATKNILQKNGWATGRWETARITRNGVGSLPRRCTVRTGRNGERKKKIC